MKKRKCIMKNMETGAEDKNQQTAIYVMTHKAFTPPPDPLYIPLHVGRAAASSYSRDEKSSPLSFCVGDNTGDHISEKNCYYSELTGMYWVWKNSHAKVVGTCHYRRYLLNEQGKLFTEAQIPFLCCSSETKRISSLSNNPLVAKFLPPTNKLHSLWSCRCKTLSYQ